MPFHEKENPVGENSDGISGAQDDI